MKTLKLRCGSLRAHIVLSIITLVWAIGIAAPAGAWAGSSSCSDTGS